jgi:hypothetical protein
VHFSLSPTNKFSETRFSGLSDLVQLQHLADKVVSQHAAEETELFVAYSPDIDMAGFMSPASVRTLLQRS